MSITKENPRTIWLGGPGVEVNDIVANEAITPGMLLERTNNSGSPEFKKHAGAGVEGSTYALNQSMLNRGIDDAYAVGDLVEAVVLQKGSTVYAIVPSGQNLAAGARLQSNGAGKLIAYSSGIAIARAVVAVDNSAGPGDARIRAEIL